MKSFLKIAFTALSLIGSTASIHAAAEQFFYNRPVNHWGWVYGTYPDKDNAKCSAEVVYKENDGSYSQLNKDLYTGELYLVFNNVDWNINDYPTKAQLRVNIYNSKNVSIRTGMLEVEAVSKTQIRIGNLEPDDVIFAFEKGMYIKVFMPGKLDNITMTLNPEVLVRMGECVKLSKTVKFPDKPQAKVKGETL